MRILVDEMPNYVEDCPFSEFAGTGLYDCKLETGHCPMCYGHSCDKLVSVDRVHVTGRGHLWVEDDE